MGGETTKPTRFHVRTFCPRERSRSTTRSWSGCPVDPPTPNRARNDPNANACWPPAFNDSYAQHISHRAYTSLLFPIIPVRFISLMRPMYRFGLFVRVGKESIVENKQRNESQYTRQTRRLCRVGRTSFFGLADGVARPPRPSPYAFTDTAPCKHVYHDEHRCKINKLLRNSLLRQQTIEISVQFAVVRWRARETFLREEVKSLWSRRTLDVKLKVKIISHDRPEGIVTIVYRTRRQNKTVDIKQRLRTNLAEPSE